MIKGSTQTNVSALFDAAKINVKTFLEKYENFKNTITLEDLRTKMEVDSPEGISLLLLLAIVAAFDHPEAFLAAWDKFKDKLTLEDLRTKAVDGPHKGNSVLWMLTAAAENGHSQPFLTVWDKFKDRITLDDLCAKAEDGCSKGPSMLWLLAAAAFNGHPDAFLAVWNKLEDKITLDDLLSKAEEGPDKGQSVLWCLAGAVSKGRPIAFARVWSKFGSIITLDNLLTKAENGAEKGKSVLWLLMNSSWFIHTVFHELLTQSSFILEEKVLNERCDNFSILDLISRGPSPFEQNIKKLIESKNVLFKGISEARKQETALKKHDIDVLSKHAKEALTAGYRNAFYDLGVFLAERVLERAALRKACLAFKKVPKNASAYYAANSQAAATLLGEATRDENTKRNERLRDALFFALKSGEDRNNLIQKICYCYITEGVGKDLCKTNPVDPDILACLRENESVKSCFELLELVKQNDQLKKEKEERNQLETKLPKNPETTPTPPLIFTQLPCTSQPKSIAIPVITDGLNQAIKPANKRERIEEHSGNTLKKQPKRCKE